MGSRLKPLRIIGLVAVGAILAYATQPGGVLDWTRLLGIPGALVGIYLLFSIGNAQIRARAQPFYHTLVLRERHVEVSDRLRGTSDRYPWEDFERLEITPRHFIIRRRGAPRAEEYMISREKLTAEEQRFLGERLVEL